MGGRLAIQADANYSDEFYYNLRNFDADKFDSYVMTNAQLSFEKNKWLATLAVRNLTDERAGVMGFDLATLWVATKSPTGRRDTSLLGCAETSSRVS